ncbi:glycosyltransferase family 2 protein [Flavobacterium sp. GT2N3]|uniref:glycosyltransferase family 2 protein n=1 Tax=unclassified Flavobacterium TaxID=196869 RepID=UPI003AACC686
MKPKVSIIIPSYNRANLIGETLDSIIAQTYINWECIIVDDGSTDNTSEIISSYLKKDNRFQLYARPKHKPKGPSACRNYGIENSVGEYLIFFDDDDIAHPQNLELCVLELSQKDIFFCRYVRDIFFGNFAGNFDYSKSYTFFFINTKDVERILKNELFFITSAVMWKKECFANHQFVEYLMYAEDWELYSRIISAGFRGISIDKCLFYGRKHYNQITGDFYGNNLISKKSFYEAILLVIKNLKQQQLISDSLLRYFVQMSLDFKEYNLFKKILYILNLPTFEKLRWQLFYTILPSRLVFHRIKKAIKKRVN